MGLPEYQRIEAINPEWDKTATYLCGSVENKLSSLQIIPSSAYPVICTHRSIHLTSLQPCKLNKGRYIIAPTGGKSRSITSSSVSMLTILGCTRADRHTACRMRTATRECSGSQSLYTMYLMTESIHVNTNLPGKHNYITNLSKKRECNYKYIYKYAELCKYLYYSYNTRLLQWHFEEFSNTKWSVRRKFRSISPYSACM